MRGLTKLIAWTLGLGGFVALVLYALVFDVWVVPGDDPRLTASIAPNLAPGDVLLVFRRGVPQTGELVRCEDPDAPGRFVAARTVGRAHDVVELRDGALLINERPPKSTSRCIDPIASVNDPKSGEAIDLDCQNEEYGGNTHAVLRRSDALALPWRVPVPADRIFLVSDNRYMHLDSRDYGPVDPIACKHIAFRLWGGRGWSDEKHRLNVLW